jgi:hypothetical protein
MGKVSSREPIGAYEGGYGRILRGVGETFKSH